MSDDNQTLPAVAGGSYDADALAAAYAKYGESTTLPFMKFNANQGRYMWGKENEAIATDTKVVFDMATGRHGWQAWGKKNESDATDSPIDAAIVPVLQPMPAYEELQAYPDRVRKLPDGTVQKQPAWQETHSIQVKMDSGDDLLFVGTSDAVINAFRKLGKLYAKEVRQHPGQKPVVALGVDSYRGKLNNEIFFPVLKIVGWENSGAAGAVPDPYRKNAQKAIGPAPVDSENGYRTAAKF